MKLTKRNNFLKNQTISGAEEYNDWTEKFKKELQHQNKQKKESAAQR